MKILITGAAGFIGSHLAKLVLAETDWDIVILDALTYAGKRENLGSVLDDPRVTFIHGSITDRELVREIFAGKIDLVAHLAAESHVDNSIRNPGIFVQTNVVGTQVLLDAAREAGVQKFLHVSTDEVYGHLEFDDPTRFTEATPVDPRSPYSASKAGSDFLALAAHRTHGLPVVVSRCSNNYGTHQDPEKLIPTIVRSIAAGKPVPIYGDGRNIRDWLPVRDHCRALLEILRDGKAGEVYNIGGDNEIANIDLAKRIISLMGRGEIVFVTDRPGHDRRYAIDASRIRSELGWRPIETDVDANLREIIDFYAS